MDSKTKTPLLRVGFLPKIELELPTAASATVVTSASTAESTTVVAAAESAIGLAILVVLFRKVDTINAEDLDHLKG